LLEDFTVTTEIAKISTDLGEVAGWAYVSRDAEGFRTIDKRFGEHAPIEEVAKAARRFMLESQRGDVMHVKDAPAKLLEIVVVDAEFKKAVGIDPEANRTEGVWCRWQWDTDHETWAEILDGRRAA